MSTTVQVDGVSELLTLAARAGEINRVQAGNGELSTETREFVSDLGTRFGSMGIAPSPADPHDELLFYRALVDAQTSVARNDRRGVRVALQRVQDAIAQISANSPVRDGRDANGVARWLAEVLADVSRQRVADILGVDRRTFTRWASEGATTRPADDEARKLRTFARTILLLLRGLTAAGAVSWFELPNPELGERTPASELERYDAAPRLERAAYALLGGDAS